MFFHDFTDALEFCLLTYENADVVIEYVDRCKKETFAISRQDVETKNDRYNEVVRKALQGGVLVTVKGR